MASLIGSAGYMYAKQSCYRCGRGDRLVDTDVHIEGEGHLALCVVCIADLGQAAELRFNDTYVSELKNRAEIAESVTADAVARLERLTSALSDEGYSGPTSVRRDKSGRFVKV